MTINIAKLNYITTKHKIYKNELIVIEEYKVEKLATIIIASYKSSDGIGTLRWLIFLTTSEVYTR